MYIVVNSHSVIIAFAFAVIVGCSHAQNAAVNICENVADNVFVADVDNCNNYYICVKQNAISQTCREGRYFNAATQSCEVTNAGCITCNSAKLEVFPMPKTCNKYIMCFSGTPVVKRCCDNLQFNTKTGLCDLQTTVDCVDNNCAISDSPDQIVYVPSASSNTTYYICMAGTPFQQSCSTGLVFNTTCNCCKQPTTTPKLYEIEDPIFTFGTPIEAISEPMPIVHHTKPTFVQSAAQPFEESNSIELEAISVDFKCPEEGTHFYPSEQSASKYIICVKGKATELHCAKGLFYDSYAEDCRELKNILLN